MSITANAPPRASAFGQAVRFSVADYHRMGEAGILGPELRTELIDGEVVEMPPIGHPHAGTVKLLSNLLKEHLGATAIVSVQDPVWLNDHTEPLPDLALLRPRPDYYRNGHPTPGDVLLIIEVADSSLSYDRDVKLPRYALAGIPEVWLVDLAGRRLLRHCQPAGRTYADVAELADLSAVSLPQALTQPLTQPDDAAASLNLRALF
jgi:Uma2 family endonuclease